MPRIDRGTVSCRLLLIWRVAHQVVKLSVVRRGPEIEFANRITHAISRIVTSPIVISPIVISPIVISPIVISRIVISPIVISTIVAGRARAVTGSAIRRARVRRFRHPYPHKSHSDRGAAETNRLRLTSSFCNSSLRKRLPNSARWSLHGIVAGPVLHDVVPGVRLGPRDADAVNLLSLRQVHDHPLRMQGIALAGETLGEIRIALPERIGIAIGHP